MNTPASDKAKHTLPAWMAGTCIDAQTLAAIEPTASRGARLRAAPVARADVGGGGPSPTPATGSSSNSGTPASSNTRASADDQLQGEPAHTSGGLSGSETEVDLMDFPDDPSDPEEAASEPLADEKKAIVIYAARNLLNTVDIRPTGHAWFSA